MPVHDWSRVSPNMFHDFHSAWLPEIRKALNHGILPNSHFAVLDQYMGVMVPDILTLRLEGATPDAGHPPESEYLSESVSGAIAVADAPPQVDIKQEVDLFVTRQKQVSIRHRSGELVALLELVAPANKRTTAALEQFRKKVQAAIDQGVHVLVLDILPPGPRDPHGIHGYLWEAFAADDFELPADKPLTLASYCASAVLNAYVQPIAVGAALPNMPLFLTPDSYVEVPLETTYQEAWGGTPRPWREMLTA